MSIFGNQSETSFEAEVAKAAEAPATPESAPAHEPVAATPEKAPETPPENIGQETAPAEVKAEKEPEKFVPLAALQDVREENKRLKEDFRNLSEAMNRFQQQLQQPQQEEYRDPLDIDPNAEPFELINNLKNEVMNWREAKRQENENNQVKGLYLNDIRAATAADPAFRDAYNHLVQSRVAELTANGMNVHQANQAIMNEEMDLARNALMNGRRPTDVILAYSKARGFTPKPKEEPKPAPAQQVQQQAAKEAAATSLSGGGKPPKADLSHSDMANLKGAAFDSAWEKMAADARKSTSLFRH